MIHLGKKREKLKVTPYGKILWGIQNESSSRWDLYLCAVMNPSELAPAVSPNMSYLYKEMIFHETTPLPSIGSEQTLPSFTKSLGGGGRE